MKFFHTIGGYVTATFVVWAATFVVGYFLLDSTPGCPILHVFGGFLLGCSLCISRHAFTGSPSAMPLQCTNLKNKTVFTTAWMRQKSVRA